MDGLERFEWQHNAEEVSKQKPVKMAKRRKMVEKEESGSESYQPEFHQIKKYGFPLKQNRISSGSWTLDQNKIYLRFMEDNEQDFKSQKNRRKTKVYYRLSKVLKKRTPDQCRSHHQKMQIKYNDQISSIIQALRAKIAEDTGTDPNDHKHQESFKRTETSEAQDVDDDSYVISVAIDFADLLVW